MASLPTSHRGMDFGIAHEVSSQGQETIASTVRHDATEEPVPDLFQTGIENDQFPVVPDRTRLQSQHDHATDMGGAQLDSVPSLPHGNAERDDGPSTPAPQLPHDNVTTSPVESEPMAKAKAVPKSKFGLDDVKGKFVHANIGPIRPGGSGKKRGATTSPVRSAGRKGASPNLQTLPEEEAPNPTAASSTSGNPEPEARAEADAEQRASEATEPQSSNPMSPTSLVPPSPTADLQLHAAATIESLAERVSMLEKILNERLLSIDDRLQVMDFKSAESNRAMHAKISRLEELSHDLSERLTELEIRSQEQAAPTSPERFDLATRIGSTPNFERHPPTRTEVQSTPMMTGRTSTRSELRHFRGEPKVSLS